MLFNLATIEKVSFETDNPLIIIYSIFGACFCPVKRLTQ